MPTLLRTVTRRDGDPTDPVNGSRTVPRLTARHKPPQSRFRRLPSARSTAAK